MMGCGRSALALNLRTLAHGASCRRCCPAAVHVPLPTNPNVTLPLPALPPTRPLRRCWRRGATLRCWSCRRRCSSRSWSRLWRRCSATSWRTPPRCRWVAVCPFFFAVLCRCFAPHPGDPAALLASAADTVPSSHAHSRRALPLTLQPPPMRHLHRPLHRPQAAMEAEVRSTLAEKGRSGAAMYGRAIGEPCPRFLFLLPLFLLLLLLWLGGVWRLDEGVPRRGGTGKNVTF